MVAATNRPRALEVLKPQAVAGALEEDDGMVGFKLERPGQGGFGAGEVVGSGDVQREHGGSAGGVVCGGGGGRVLG